MRDIVKQTVRRLRRQQTEGEAVFWSMVRARQILGKKFLRQFPISFKYNNKTRFIVVDFYCHEARLVVEIDGSIHKIKKYEDKEKERILYGLGLKILRFGNEEILSENGLVLRIVKNHLGGEPLSS